MRSFFGVLLLSTMAFGCAARSSRPLESMPAGRPLSSSERESVIRAYARQIPADSGVRAVLAGGRRIDATLLAVDADRVVLQPRGRLREPEISVPFAEIVSLERLPERGGVSVGKAILIGAAAGAGATIAVLFILFATLSD